MKRTECPNGFHNINQQLLYLFSVLSALSLFTQQKVLTAEREARVSVRISSEVTSAGGLRQEAALGARYTFHADYKFIHERLFFSILLINCCSEEHYGVLYCFCAYFHLVVMSAGGAVVVCRGTILSYVCTT